jgi:putative NADPH-quinone reductase
MTQICIIQGHPDSRGGHLCHGLADAYRQGALDAGQQVSYVDIGALKIDFVRNPDDMARPPNESILMAQQTILEAEHLMII